MKKTSFFLLFLPYFLCAQIQRPVGINLSGVVDYSAEFVFVDAMNQSRRWIAHDDAPNAAWSSDVQVPLRNDGYPLEIPYDNGINPPQLVRALLFFGELEGLIPNGQYRLQAKGQGTIRLWGAVSGLYDCPVDTLIDYSGTLAGIALEIEESLASDPIHDIRFVLPGFHDTYETEPFHPALLEFLDDFQVIRFMDWMNTNNSPVEEWNERATPDFVTQTMDNGVAYEHIIDLCNRLGKDPWICVPHRASDDYIAQMAQFFDANLDPGRTIYVEYSNELWNGIFEQSQYADSMGLVLGYSGQPWERAWQFTAKRSADVFRIFHNQITDNQRFVKILPAWAASPWVTNYIVERFNETLYNPDGQTADAVAVAPYFGGIADAMGDAGLIPTATVEQIVDSMEANLPEVYGWIDGIQEIAEEYGLRMMAYEGGQHLVAGPQYHNDDLWVEKLLDANRHPRMQDLYCQYLDYWYDTAEGDLFCIFSSHGNYSKWGAWGIKEHYADTLSPKYQGLKNCVFSYNSISSSAPPPFAPPAQQSAFPSPSPDGILTLQHDFDRPHIMAFAPDGRALDVELLQNGAKISQIRVHGKGLNYVVLEKEGRKEVFKVIVR